MINITLSKLPEQFKKDFYKFEKKIKKLNKRFRLRHNLSWYLNVLYYILTLIHDLIWFAKD